MGKHSTGSAGGCKLDSKNRPTGCNKGNPNVPDSEKRDTCGPPTAGDKNASGTGKRDKSGSGSGPGGGGNCAFGSRDCNKERTKGQQGHGHGKKKFSGGEETCGVGPKNISGAHQDEENGRGSLGTQTREVNNTKTGCDIAGYGPLKPRHKGGVVDPSGSGSDHRPGQGYGYERGQGHGQGHRRNSRPDYRVQNQRQNQNQNQNGRNSDSDYNALAQNKQQNQNQGKRRGSFEDNSRSDRDNPEESESARAQRRNKAVGDSLVTGKEVCAPLPAPAPKSTHTIGTDPEIQVLSKTAYGNEPESGSNRTYAQANEFTDTSDLRIPSAHAPMPVSQRKLSKSQHSPSISRVPPSVSPRRLSRSQNPDSNHSPAQASQIISPGKLSKSQNGRGSEAHESPNTSLLYAHPYNTSPSSVQPSVAPPGGSAKASSCRAPAPTNKSNSSQRKNSSLLKGTKRQQLRDDEYFEDSMSQGGGGSEGAKSNARTLGNMSHQSQSGPGGAKSVSPTRGGTSQGGANSLAKTHIPENMDPEDMASVAASSRPVQKQSQAPAQTEAPHLKCCAKGEEGGKNCVVCKPYLAGNGTGPVTIRYKAIVVDAKPTLAKISEARFPLESSCSVAPSRAAPTVAVSRLADRSQDGDPIDNAFQDIVDNNTPMVWVFGYTQSSIVRNKAHCIDIIAAKNKLAVINLSSHVGYWLGPAANKENDKNSTFGKSTATGATGISKAESRLADLHDKIRARARKILHAHNITGAGNKSELESATLPIEDLCELLKLCMVSVMNPASSKSKAAVPVPPAGVIIDNFPLCTQEGVEAETILYKCMVCLYFSSVAWSLTQDKEMAKDPPVIKPMYHLRNEPYSEFAAEKGADFFGFKTIKVINAEDLEDMQITDINSLVRQHLDGNGLNLHKVMRKKGGNATGHQYTPSGRALTTLGLKSNIVMDHNDFLSQGNRTPAPSSAAEVTSGQLEVPNLSREFSKKQLMGGGGGGGVGSQANSKTNKSGGGSGAFGKGTVGSGRGGTSGSQVRLKSKLATPKLGSQVSGSGSYFSDSESMTEKSEVPSGKKQGAVQSPNYPSTPFKKKGKG